MYRGKCTAANWDSAIGCASDGLKSKPYSQSRKRNLYIDTDDSFRLTRR